MTETPAQPATRPAPRPSPKAATWRARDLISHAPGWGVSAAAVRAAFKSSGKDSVASPDEAEKLVRTFLAKDLAEEEREGREARAKAKGKK